jgi:Conserved hypothetical protein 2217 (DUF2460)
MASFPLLGTGTVAQYPSQREIAFQTTVARFVDGTEQRFRSAKGPARRWIIQLSQISAEEMAALEDFFESAQGRFGSFTFVDPWDSVEYADCSLDGDQIDANATTAWRWATRLVIRNNQV